MKLSEIDLTNLDTFVRGEQYEAWRVLRAEAPVFWHERKPGNGFWSITRYDDALKVYHDPDTYSSERGISLIFSAAGASEGEFTFEAYDAIRRDFKTSGIPTGPTIDLTSAGLEEDEDGPQA